MLKFLENLRQSENKKAKVLLKHSLWGDQGFETEALHIFPFCSGCSDHQCR